MKMKYDREKDILLIELNDGKVDHAEESENIIMHFSEDKKPVLLEILDATDFLHKTIDISVKAKGKKFVEV